MGHSEFDPAAKERRRWNAGRMVGVKHALKPQQVSATRFRERRLRDRAMFDLAIDSKLRGFDVVKVKIGDVVSSGRIRSRAIVIQQSASTGFPGAGVAFVGLASRVGVDGGPAAAML
jgi:hypothetical protein